MLFASLRTRFGPQIELPDLELPASVSEVRQALEAFGAWTTGSRIAVNQRFATDETTVEPGNEVAVVPPVSGG